MFKMKVRTVGKRTGIVLPKEVLAWLKAVKGDWITLTECPEGVQIKRCDPDFERQMALACEAVAPELLGDNHLHVGRVVVVTVPASR